jgi:hypothetical protein
MALRHEATQGLKKLKPSADVATLTLHQNEQAAAIRAARAGARPGNLFGPGVAPIIARVVKEELTKLAEARRDVDANLIIDYLLNVVP